MRLPEDVRFGQAFEVALRQASNVHSKIVGIFTLRVSGRAAAELATDVTRFYAVLQGIMQNLDSNDRWHPVVTRLSTVVRGHVNGLGIDADGIKPDLDPSDLEDLCPARPSMTTRPSRKKRTTPRGGRKGGGPALPEPTLRLPSMSVPASL